MSLWWARREQLDQQQVRMIEQLPLRDNHLILGPPGSGKTNVLLRRAQYARTQGIVNVLVLSFTRPLTEFIKTGCYDNQDREIFPPNLVLTIESWIRGIFKDHGHQIPDTGHLDFVERKAFLAIEAQRFIESGKFPRYETIFVDEAQDLIPEEINLLNAWASNLFFVGDDRQRIHNYAPGLTALRSIIPNLRESTLTFHYRLARELCDMADRIQTVTGAQSLAATSHYSGPRPGHVEAHGRLTRQEQIADAADRLKNQLRVYDGLLNEGDRLGVIVPRREDRQFVLEALEADPGLYGKVQIIRARSGDPGDRYDPSFDNQASIIIVTEKGCKGLEFRAAHWLFCDQKHWHRTIETYYTIVTRPKTRLDFYFETNNPAPLAKAYAPPQTMDW